MFSIDDMLRRQDGMETRRSNWDNLWELVAEKLLTHANDFKSLRSPGEVRTNKVYDAFPTLALNRYAAALESGLTPRTTLWHHIRTGEEEIDDDEEVKGYLEAYNRLLWRSRYSPKSNFANQNHEVLLSHGAFGNGPLFIEDHPQGGCSYRSIHMSQLWYEEDRQGFLDTFHRKFEMKARHIRDRVENYGWTMPGKVAKALENDKLDDPFEVLHVVMPREDHDPDRLDHKGMPFTNVYICLDGKEPMLEDAGYRELPYMVARGATSSREIYARGVAIQMFPDIKMLNEMRRDVIEAANMAADPPSLLHEDGILGEFRLMPGSRNYGGVNDDGRQMVIPYNNGADPGIGLEMIQDTRNQIDDAFLGVYFRVLLENPQMTATQALLIAQQQGQMTAPTVGRLQSEYLDRIIRRESGILHRQGKHPPMPGKLLDFMQATGERLSIEYESPMTRAARTGEAVAIQTTFEALAPWAQIMGPEVFAKFDPDKVAEVMATVNGVPREVLKDDALMEAEDDQKAQQQAMAATLEAAPVVAQSIDSLTKAQAQAAANPQVAA